MKAGTEIILCPICRKAIHTQYSSPILGRSTVSSRDPHGASGMLTAMMLAAEAEHLKMIMRAEEACRTHFEEQHPRRLRLWKRFKWNWILQRRWPWSRSSEDTFDFGANA
jgi:hypothetical protein